MDASINEVGFVGKVLVTVKPPQVWDDAEPETLSYHRAVVYEPVTKTEVVRAPKGVAVIVAVEHGLT